MAGLEVSDREGDEKRKQMILIFKCRLNKLTNLRIKITIPYFNKPKNLITYMSLAPTRPILLQ